MKKIINLFASIGIVCVIIIGGGLVSYLLDLFSSFMSKIISVEPILISMSICLIVLVWYFYDGLNSRNKNK